jgi:hypothetical protein
MTITQLRVFVVGSGLGLTGATLLFFITAHPLFHYPLQGEEGWDIAQISLPVFLGFLGSAAQFAVNGDATPQRSSPMLTTLVVGPVTLYVLVLVALLAAFGWGNRQGVADGGAMSPDLLKTIYSALLGLVAVTSSIASTLLFRKDMT